MSKRNQLFMFGPLLLVPALFFLNGFNDETEVRTIEVTISEGTNMAAALSPDQQDLAIDLLGRIWLLPATGGQAVALTDEFGDARQPAWSPDGKRVAFQAYWDGNWHIWTVDRDGRHIEQLTHGPFDHREPDWSPDGNRIVCSSDRSGRYDLWILEPATREISQLTEEAENEYAPAWSPDGTRIAFVSEAGGETAIQLIAPETGKRQLLHQTEHTISGPALEQ